MHNKLLVISHATNAIRAQAHIASSYNLGFGLIIVYIAVKAHKATFEQRTATMLECCFIQLQFKFRY